MHAEALSGRGVRAIIIHSVHTEGKACCLWYRAFVTPSESCSAGCRLKDCTSGNLPGTLRSRRTALRQKSWQYRHVSHVTPLSSMHADDAHTDMYTITLHVVP